MITWKVTISNVASNRSVYLILETSFYICKMFFCNKTFQDGLKSKKTNAMYRTHTFFESYDKFPLKDKLAFSSFYKCIEGKYKHPHRLTDLCEFCEYYRKLQPVAMHDELTGDLRFELFH